MAYKQVYTISEQNDILREGGEQAIIKLWQAYELQLNDFAIHIMLEYGQKLDKGKIEDCQSAVKLKVCEIIQKKPLLTSDFMAYIQEAVIHTIENELFGQDHIVQGERNLLKRAKVQKAREALIRGGKLNPTSEEIFDTVNSMFGNVGKVKNGRVYHDITVRFINNILVKTVSLDEFNERTMPSSPEKSPEEQVQANDFSREIQRVFSVLDKRDKMILSLQGEEMTQKQAAKKLGMETAAYKFRKNVLKTYLAAALMCLGYSDACGVTLRKYEVIAENHSKNLRPVLASLNTEEQRVLLNLLSWHQKKIGRGKSGEVSKKVQDVLAYLTVFDEEFGGRYGYRQLFGVVLQK